MKLSIATICFNEVERIEKTIKSVLKQTFNNFQYIVIDGASTDGTVDIVNKYADKIDKFISEPDKGIYNAMNKGINYCTGEFIYFLNGGDEIHSEKTLENIISYGLTGDLIYGNIAIKELSGKQWIFEMPQKLTKEFLLKKTIPHQATLIRRSLFNKTGKYDEEYQIAADYKFTLQAIYQHNCKLQYVDETFAVFDRSGIGFLNPEKREEEKHKAQIEIFGLHASEKLLKADKLSSSFQLITNIMSKLVMKSSKDFIDFRNIPNPPIFDIEEKFIFFPNNKCGQTSITGGSQGNDKIGALAGRCVVWKVNKKKWNQFAGKNWEKAIKFTIVRHPYSRFLSTYRYLKPIYKFELIDDLFAEIENKGLQFDDHLQPQWTSSFNSDGKRFVDYILRLEHISQDWEKISNKVGAKPYPQLNITLKGSENNELSQSQKERIYKLYEKDFILFGFKK